MYSMLVEIAIMHTIWSKCNFYPLLYLIALDQFYLDSGVLLPLNSKGSLCYYMVLQVQEKL